MDKRGKIKIGLIVFIILIFIILLLQIQTILSFEESPNINKSEMNIKYNVKPPQMASIGKGGGAKISTVQNQEKNLTKNIIELLETRPEETLFEVTEFNNISTLNYDPEILEEFNRTNQTWVRVLVYHRSNLERSTFKDLEEREEYVRNKTKLTFSYIPETKMKIIQTGLDPDSFSAEITKEGFDKLINDSRIKNVYLGRSGKISLSESVPLINANDVWSLGYTGSGKKVCIIDTGVNSSHPDLSGKIIDEYCYCSLPEGNYSYCCSDHTSYNDDAKDNNGHGTHVAGIVVSQDSTYKGVAYGANLYVIKVCNSSGDCYRPDIGSAIDRCRIWGANVISISIGDGENHPGVSSCPSDINNDINEAYNANISVIIASGNEEYTNGINYPACAPHAISVGATTKSDTMASYTNRGSNLDLLAPGHGIWSLRWNPAGDNPRCLETGDIMACDGTSQATPHVSGAAALLLQRKSDATPDEIENALKQTGVNIAGYPRIDVLAAINYICDKDSDGYNLTSCGGNDCNDTDTSIHPGATEVCDNKDNDCDDLIDEGCVENCTEPGYEQCAESSYGDCSVSIAVNYYTNVNNIKWGEVNDSWDPYVINEYRVGWKAVDAQQMYYDVNDPNGGDCYYGGCNGEEISSTGTKVTVTAPGTANTENVLGYDDTASYACWVWFNGFNPNYGASNSIYILKCFNNSDCSSGYYCNKSGSWSSWDCVAKKSNGQACTSDSQCSSGYCDNDGVGLADDGWCFAPYNTYFDGQETSYCEVSTDFGTVDCDERQVGADLNKCSGISYYEEECNNNCSNTDVTNIFECNDAGCSCSESLCDGLATGSNITTCSSTQTYFADKCSSTAGGEDRGDNICRNSTFASGCSADSQCNGIVAGTGNCTSSCVWAPDISPNITFTYPTPTNGSNQSSTSIFVNVSASDIGRGNKNISTFINFDNSLVSWWRMDDVNASGDPIDYAGRNNGSKKGNAAQTIGKLGKGFKFDGDGDYVNVGNDASLNFGAGDFTYSAWIKTNTSNVNKRIIAQDRNLLNHRALIVDNSGANIDFWCRDASGNAIIVQGSININDNKWHYVAGIRKGSIGYVYIDGNPDGSATNATTGNCNGNSNTSIGARDYYPAEQLSFNGSIDDVMIFNRSLSATEIAALYANTSSKYLGVNFTGLLNGTHTFKAYVQDLAGNVNATEKRMINIT